MVAWWIVLSLLALGGLLAYGVAYFRLRGARAVTCPENHRPVGVEVNAARAAAAAILGGSSLHLKDCTRWPEKAGCGQECLREIESSEDGCLVRSILTRWYDGKSCAVCGSSFARIDWLDRTPAILGQDGVSVDWRDVRPEEVAKLLATHRPICFDCHVTQTLRREYPNLVVDRPWDRAGTIVDT